MPHYQLRRPSPVQIYPRRRFRREATTTQEAGEWVNQKTDQLKGRGTVVKRDDEKDGSKSPDSPKSSSASSVEDHSDSEDDKEKDEIKSPKKSSAPPPPPSDTSSTSAPPAQSTLAAAVPPQSSATSATPPAAHSSAGPVASSKPAAQPPQPPASSTTAVKSSSQDVKRPSSTPANNVASPPATISSPDPTPIASNPVAATTTAKDKANPTTIVTSAAPSQSKNAPGPPLSDPRPPFSSSLPPSKQPAPSIIVGGDQQRPQQVKPEEKTMITRGGMAAAITLSVLGALAIIIAVVILFKRRKRQNRYGQRVADDAFSPSNTGSLHAPETAHVNSDIPIFTQGGGSHLTQSTDRSNTLFGAGRYERPETVSTNRNHTGFPVGGVEQPIPTPNPFVDPPLNKAYDVLAGRPRSTTLTDRGSWIKNPFRNPESERFDPFGELQEKARSERRRQLDQARKEAERNRAREFEKKEAMGLAPPEAQKRKGSDVTVEGMGVLDRGGGGMYR